MKRWTRTCLWALILAVSFPTAPAFSEAAKPLRVVLVPERNVFDQQRKYKILSDYSSRKLPFKVIFEVVGSYRDALELLNKGEAEGAFMGSFIAACGMEQYGLEPVVRPQWKTGESTYGGVVFKSRASNATADPGSWRGRSIVFASPHTSAGYFYPLAVMRAAGITDPADTFFSEKSFSGSHDSAVWMVFKGIAELGAAKSTVFDEYLKNRPETDEQIVVLSRGGTFPDSNLMFNRETPKEVREAVKDMFLAMEKDPEGREALAAFGALRFIETGKKDFAEVFAVVEAAGFKMRDLRILDEGKDKER